MINFRLAFIVTMLNMPSLNIRGMTAARTGAQASNVIPAFATATIDLRLVRGIDHQAAAQRVLDHIRKQGYFIVDHDPDAGSRMSHPKVAKVIVEPGGYKAARIHGPAHFTTGSAHGRIRAGAGSEVAHHGRKRAPLHDRKILHAPTITVPIANHDNNQHSFDENIRLQNLWDGIDLLSALLAI